MDDASALDDYLGKPVDFYGVCGNQFKIALPGEAPVVFDVLEDESDGYRSYLDAVKVVDSEGPFFGQPIARVEIRASTAEHMDTYELVDVERGHVWLEFGTNNTCDYYPCFVFHYEAMPPPGENEPKCDALAEGEGVTCAESYVCKQCTDGWHDGCYEGGKCTCGFCTGDEASKTYPKVESQGFDLAQYTRDYVLPEAAAFCERGQLHEIATQRDAKPAERNVVWLVEVQHGLWETTSALPNGMPPLQVRCRPGQLRMCEVYWTYAQMLDRYRVARGAAARKMARETVFMEAGRGCQS